MPSKNNLGRLENSLVVAVVEIIVQNNYSYQDFEYVLLPQMVSETRFLTELLPLTSIVIVNNKNYKNRSYDIVMIYDINIKQ
jgi:hypothetical protein